MFKPLTDVHTKHRLLSQETEEQRAILTFAKKLIWGFWVFFLRRPPVTVVTNVLQLPEVGSAF